MLADGLEEVNTLNQGLRALFYVVFFGTTRFRSSTTERGKVGSEAEVQATYSLRDVKFA